MPKIATLKPAHNLQAGNGKAAYAFVVLVTCHSVPQPTLTNPPNSPWPFSPNPTPPVTADLKSCVVVSCVVENERLSWELEQVRGLVDMQELAVLRMDLQSLRNQILLMAQREDNAQVGHTPPLHFAFWARRGGKGV